MNPPGSAPETSPTPPPLPTPNGNEGRFDLVLLDINMPGIEGVEACREIRALAPKIGILMVTVRDAEHDMVRALEAGADDYVTRINKEKSAFRRQSAGHCWRVSRYSSSDTTASVENRPALSFCPADGASTRLAISWAFKTVAS